LESVEGGYRLRCVTLFILAQPVGKIHEVPQHDVTNNHTHMQRLISTGELDSMLLSVCTSNFTYYRETLCYFQDLYWTGCRSTELLNPQLWKLDGADFILTTLKTKEERRITHDMLTAHTYTHLAQGIKPYNSLTYDQLTLEFRKVMPLHPIWVGNKIADTYLFRYNRARLHFEAYQNVERTMKFFGWKSPSIASKYILSELYYHKIPNM
jgi:hypothetical protein